jgi:hypothetical protein
MAIKKIDRDHILDRDKIKPRSPIGVKQKPELLLANLNPFGQAIVIFQWVSPLPTNRWV